MNDRFTILYVDDEPQNLVSFRAAFRRRYAVLTAESGREALETMRGKPVDLVISDQRMPEMSGVQFLEAAADEFPDTVRMILTGYADMSSVVEAVNKGRIFRYVTKPWDEGELAMTIENARGFRSLRRKNHDLVEQLKQKVAEQERTLKLFMRYVPEEVVEKALAQAEDSIFEGELRQVCVLFCDIRGFTSLSERLDPKQVVTVLNDYYALMTEAVRRHNGSVNQFVGDEVFAVFGAPAYSRSPEDDALACALEMAGSLVDRLNERHAALLDPPLRVGIGLNAGEVVAGNLGSEVKMEYSVVGDVVNTGKRVETLTKERPNAVLLSEAVRERLCPGRFALEAWPPVAVRGKSQPLQVYEAKGYAEGAA